MKHNEDTRVKIPTILHLTRLGYKYLSLKDSVWDTSTNIFTDIFYKSIASINPELTKKEIYRLYDEVSLSLENEDLGKVFFEKLINRNGIKLIDFENFENNSFNVVTELPCVKDDEEFRPDITILINGMPLVFIEVKKPNNRDGILAEHKRMGERFSNKKFRKFINITQMMIFSNNMEYDDASPETIEGAFYASTAYRKPIFNYFREEDDAIFNGLVPLSDDVENFVLKDTNYVSIKSQKEFVTNKDPYTPTHRICTSLLTKDRLSFMLQYAIAYVKEKHGLEKHIMRYPQLFATKAIEEKLDEGVKKGIIWHTQGSGKTALTYYNVKHLTDYYNKKGIVPKFYFIVDRLDLLKQAAKEFRARGLVVHEVNSREAFSKEIKSNSVLHNNSGKAEITVVNIHKFQDDPDVIKNSDYNLGIQRVFFLDEVHRSYNPEGSFLANLQQADGFAIKIGLTGTPLLGKEYNSKSLFGGYIHKYYYNKSIADGYTLRLIREEIETQYKLHLKKALDEIEILKGDSEKEKVYAHPKFVEPMLDYIVQDFEQARIRMSDNTIGAMVVCDSSAQAKALYETFQVKYSQEEVETNSDDVKVAATPKPHYESDSSKLKSARVILHDIGTKEDRDTYVTDFKEGKIDILFVYNMLLTGFDAKRLKKLYLGRVIKSHNLLQTLTRVNRTYKKFKYGYIVDFADISTEFDKTNRAYFDELQSELGDEFEHYNNLFKKREEIEQEIGEIKEVLFKYNTENGEVFTNQLNEINDRATMLKITKALNNAKALYNLIRLSDDRALLEELDFRKLNVLSRLANDRLSLINQKEQIENSVDTTNLLNIALEDIAFAFTKVSEGELVLADKLKDYLKRTREGLANNFDPKDPEFITLKEELERLFKKKNLSEVTKEEMERNIEALRKIYAQAKELERKNQLLKAKYDNDEKYARLHKRLMEKSPLTESESKLFEALKGLKTVIDSEILKNSKMLENESFVEKMIMRLVIDQFKNKQHIALDAPTTKRINRMIVNEYMDEYYGRTA